MSKISVRGFIETSFLDWDGKVTSVIFLPNCNFRCPYCDNVVLIEAPETLSEISLKEIDQFLLKRKDFIDGIVISGGEPSIYSDLPEFIKHFKDLGFLVKLDTNGSNPTMHYALCTMHLVDYVAMDLKAPLDDRYHKACGVKVDLEKIKKSVQLLMDSEIDYEFRTTVVPTILDKKDIEDMGKAIAGAKKWALQQFVPDHTLDERLRIVAPYPKEKIFQMAETAKKYVANTIVRGV